jgi:peptidoglycan-associated lipoprotein
VKEFLVSLGVDAARLQTKSFGKERPVCAESDDSCWQQNRRGYSVISAGAGS